MYMHLFADMVVYNKKKIQMIFVEYGFNFTREVKNMYISFVALPLMKYKYFPIRWMKLKPYSTKTFEYTLYIFQRFRFQRILCSGALSYV